MRRFFFFCGELVSFVLSLRIRGIFESIHLNYYTGLYKRFFKGFGDGSFIVPKLRMLVGAGCITVGKNCIIGKNAKLCAYKRYGNQVFKPSVTIGDGVQIGDNVHITCIQKIVIGNGVLMGSGILISDNAHGSTDMKDLQMCPTARQLSTRCGGVIIEDDVWICEKATILPGVRIGKGAIIGSNAVVTKDVPPYTVVVGQPSRYINHGG